LLLFVHKKKTLPLAFLRKNSSLLFCKKEAKNFYQ